MRVNIKTIITLLSIAALNLGAATEYLKESVKLDSVDLFYGIPLTKVDTSVKLEGFREINSNIIYGTKNLSLQIAEVKDKKIVKVLSKEKYKEKNMEKVSLIFKIDNDLIDEDYYEAWGEKEEIFLEKCSQCHASPEIGSHTMLEWESLFGSMRDFAQPSKEEEQLILRYLKTFAKDGIIEEE